MATEVLRKIVEELQEATKEQEESGPQETYEVKQTREEMKKGTFRDDCKPGVNILPGFKAEHINAVRWIDHGPDGIHPRYSGVNVWEDGEKLFIRIPNKGDHPTQIRIDLNTKIFNAGGYD